MKWSASPTRAHHHHHHHHEGKVLQSCHPHHYGSILRKALSLHNIKLPLLLFLLALFLLKTGIHDSASVARPFTSLMRSSAFHLNVAAKQLLHTAHPSYTTPHSKHMIYSSSALILENSVGSSQPSTNIKTSPPSLSIGRAFNDATSPLLPNSPLSDAPVAEDATRLELPLSTAGELAEKNSILKEDSHINGSSNPGPLIGKFIEGQASLKRAGEGVTTSKDSEGTTEEEEASHISTPLWLTPNITDWDQQRPTLSPQHLHQQAGAHSADSILLVSSSRPKACDNAHGDHLLLKFMKNKMDYCRLHNIEIFYNMVQMDRDMIDYWSKLPLVRTLMITHPEVEWIWWMDSDAMFTDMTFELPMAKYKDYNLVIHGWEHLVYRTKSWIGLNAGIFLLRNCQWSLDLIDSWASMGINSKVREAAGKVLAGALSDRPLYEADDQSALVYLLNTQKETWGSKVFLESSYCLHGYWDVLVDKYEALMESSRPGYGDDRWPFITHFVGCKPCAKRGNYAEGRCLEQMERAFNFADNQVLERYGFKHMGLGSSQVERINTQELLAKAKS